MSRKTKPKPKCIQIGCNERTENGLLLCTRCYNGRVRNQIAAKDRRRNGDGYTGHKS